MKRHLLSPGFFAIRFHLFLVVFLLTFTNLFAQLNDMRATSVIKLEGVVRSSLDLVEDAEGNIYVFTVPNHATFDFDPGPGDATVVNNNPHQPGYLALVKYDKFGNFLWVNAWGVKETDGLWFAAKEIIPDNAGSVYLKGFLSLSVSDAHYLDMDPGVGVDTVYKPWGVDVPFVVKMDAATGAYEWIDRDPAVVESMGIPSLNLDGNIIITKRHFDAAGNQYVIGRFSGTRDFNPGPGEYMLTGTSAHTCFLLKLDPSGNFLWARHWGGVATPPPQIAGQRATDVAVDENGKIYVSGVFRGTGDFDPGTEVHSLTRVTAAGDHFISVFDSDGNFEMVKQIPGDGRTANQYMNPKVAVRPDGSAFYLAASFNAPTNANHGGTPKTLTPLGGLVDVFIVRYDDEGNVEYAGSYGGAGSDDIVSIDVLPDGQLSVVGTFSPSTIDVSPSLDYETNLTATYDAFYMATLEEFNNTTLPVTFISFTAQQSGNHSLLNWITASEQNNKGFTVEHSTDGTNWNSVGFVNTKAANGNSSTTLHYTYIHTTPAAGKNYYRLQQTDADGKYEYSIVAIVDFSSTTSVSVYPNPATDKVILQGVKAGAVVKLYDSNGRLLHTQKTNTVNPTIYLDKYSVGLYLIRVQNSDNEKAVVVKIIKE